MKRSDHRDWSTYSLPTYPSPEVRPYYGLLTKWFPLYKALLNPYFGGVVRGQGGGWLISHEIIPIKKLTNKGRILAAWNSPNKEGVL